MNTDKVSEARKAYAEAPHGYKMRALYRMQQAVKEQLKREAGKIQNV